MDDTEKVTTTNSKGEIVSGSRVRYMNIEYDVGQVYKRTLMLYKNGRFEMTARIDEVEAI